MAVILNASTSSGFIQTADTSGSLVLQSNGTTQLTVDSTGVYGQVERGTAVASTSGTSIEFTGIPSWVKRVTVMFNGISTSGTSNYLVQFGDSGGIETTGYVGSNSFTGAGGTGGTIFTNGISIISSVAAVATYSGHLIITNVSSNIWVGSSYIARGDSAVSFIGGTTKTLSDVLTQVRITTVNGTDTFDAGTINILYEG